MVSSGLLRRVALVRTDVSEEPGASLIRVTKIGELGTTQVATSNRRTSNLIFIFTCKIYIFSSVIMKNAAFWHMTTPCCFCKDRNFRRSLSPLSPFTSEPGRTARRTGKTASSNGISSVGSVCYGGDTADQPLLRQQTKTNPILT
jgi:hypothetical protein